MNTYTPNYYDRFHCIASLCRHNCCIGWEIDIDEDSLKKYSAVCGDFAKRLNTNISTEETPHFILGEDERCPFLNEKNLCDIITDLGENYLCQICRDHPRFINYFSSRTEKGLGLTCEEAARIILTEEEPFFIDSQDVIDEEIMTDAEYTFFQIRDSLLDILTDREKSLSERIEEVLSRMDINSADLDSFNWAEEFSCFEILDEGWKEYLSLLSSYDPSLSFPSKEYEIPFENLMIYFIYRHLAGALDDGCLNERVAFAYVSVQSIYRIAVMLYHRNKHFSVEDLVEISRMYSSEIEYSEDNTDSLLDTLFEIV